MKLRNIKLNPKLLFVGAAFNGVNALNPFITLFYLQRDLKLDQIVYLSIVWAIVSLITEVPTGYLADRFGRRNTMLLGILLIITSYVATIFAHGFASFIGIFILMSASFSCFSGTVEAMLYDSLKEVKKEHEMPKYNGRISAADLLFQMVITGAAALIAKNLTGFQFQILIVINILSAFLAGVFFSLLAEPKHVQSVTKEEKGIFKESIETIKENPFLLRAALSRILIFIAGFLVWRVYQPILSNVGFNGLHIGIFYFIFEILTFPGYWFSGAITRFFGAARVIRWSVILAAASLIIAIFSKNPWVLFITILATMVLWQIRYPVFSYAMNNRVKSKSRATTLSNLNVLRGVCEIPLLFIAGYLAGNDAKTLLIVSFSICVATLIFFDIKKKDLELKNAKAE